MIDQIELARQLLESRGYTVEYAENKMFDIDESDMISLNEFSEVHGSDYRWEPTLEELLYDLDEDDTVRDDQDKVFEVGDIIMTNNYTSSSSGKQNGDPHKILLIYSKRVTEDTIQYAGFLLSSKEEKANIHGRYPNNIYIEDYSTILSKGTKVHIPAIIRVDDLVTFTNHDLSTRGTWKGVASLESRKFIADCYQNHKDKNDKLNFNMKWVK